MTLQRLLSRFLSDYGMLIVLLLICGYYAVVTLTEQTPRGVQGAAQLMSDIPSHVEEGSSVLILSKSSPQERQFAEALRSRLNEANIPTAGVVQGSPFSMRQALDSLAKENTSIGLLATTESSETVVNNLKDRVAGLSDAAVIAPESYMWPTFLLPGNLRNVANQIVVIAIIAVGMTMVIITAGIDLSVGSLIALSAVTAAWIIRWMGGTEATVPEMILASLAAILMCGLVGLFSGFTVTQFNVPPFIATLGIMQVASGLAYIISSGESIYEIPDAFTWLGRGADLFSLPNAVVLMIVIYALAHILMTHTTLGRYIYAVGGNPEAARLSGIRVKWVLLFVYTMSGLMAGLGGIIQASQLKSGAPTYGLLYELYVIAAVVVGGTSLSGGQGKIMGTLIGAFIIGVIQNGMNLTGVESYTQKVVLGFVILGAVLLDMLKKKEWWQQSVMAGAAS